MVERKYKDRYVPGIYMLLVYKLKESGETRQLTELYGSFPYMAPEVHYLTPYEAEPIDVWGIGIILFTLLLGSPSNFQSFSYILRINVPPRYSLGSIHSTVDGVLSVYHGEIFNEPPWNRLKPEALSLICGLLAVEPERRMTLAELFAHRGAQDQVKLRSKALPHLQTT
ncbi:hypothetical protein BD769DRAFT_1740759 [Suillus cothurnatus]|nr:hypothetical protein BD769DRAFT_1740759 [Suillus cothurnatus]